MTKIEQAKQFSHDAHDRIGQKRKYSGEPYWTHTDSVAEIVASVGGTEEMIMAAHLHDVLEDVTPKCSDFSEEQIKTLFGDKVLQLVKELTDVYTKEAFPNQNRAQRHAKERARINLISPEAKTIKLADLINNTASIVEHDKDFAKVYLKEKLELLPYLTDGDPSLLQRASIQTLLGCNVLGIDIPMVSP